MSWSVLKVTLSRSTAVTRGYLTKSFSAVITFEEVTSKAVLMKVVQPKFSVSRPTLALIVQSYSITSNFCDLEEVTRYLFNNPQTFYEPTRSWGHQMKLLPLTIS